MEGITQDDNHIILFPSVIDGNTNTYTSNMNNDVQQGKKDPHIQGVSTYTIDVTDVASILKNPYEENKGTNHNYQ